MSFGFYKACTIQTGQVPSSQANFPVLLPFLAADNDLRTVGNGGHVQNANGYDIRPYSDSALTTALTFELVTYDAATGIFEMWVKTTAVDAGVVYVAYGDSGISTDGSSTSAWDSNFKGVWHFGDGTTLNLNDSTSNAYNLTNHNSATATSGQIKGAVNLVRASSQWLTAGSFSLGTNAVTLSAWIYSSDLTANQIVIVKQLNVQFALMFLVSLLFLRADINSGGEATASVPSNSAWHLISGTISGSTDQLYIDGAAAGTAGTESFVDASDTLAIGSTPDGGGNLWDGNIDEVRISNNARSADWLTTEYNNQVAPATFFGKGSEQTVSGDTLLGQIWM